MGIQLGGRVLLGSKLNPEVAVDPAKRSSPNIISQDGY